MPEPGDTAALACPNGHGETIWHYETGEEIPLCPECEAPLLPAEQVAASRVEEALFTRRVHAAYDLAVMPASQALPDLAVSPAEGEGVLMALVLTTPDKAQRDVVLVGDAQAEVIVRGLVRAHQGVIEVVRQLPPDPPHKG